MPIIGLSSSCNDKDDLPSLEGTVWIHRFPHYEHNIIQDHIVDAAAYALCFGKKNVEYYVVDEKLKVLRLITTFDYQVREEAIAIGTKVGPMGEDFMYFRETIYFRFDQSSADILHR